MSDLISIIIPNFNKAPYLRECLNSVLAQAYSNWECIIVDDHSTDGSWAIIEDFSQKDSRFKIFVRPNHLPKGGNLCRNFAISLSKGIYCVFLDSDDVLADFCLVQRLESIANYPENDYWVFKSLLFDKSPSDAVKFWNIETEESDLVRFLRTDALWQTTGPIYKKSFLERIGGFDDSLPFWQDYEFHLRAIILGGKYSKFFNLPPDSYIREGDRRSLSRSTPFTGDKEILGKRIGIYKKIKGHSITSGIYFSREESFTWYSILYFLVAQYWVKHGDLQLFMKEWKGVCGKWSSTKTPYLLGIIHITIIKLSIKHRMTLPIKVGFENLFSSLLLDYYLINRTHLGKVPNSDDAVSQSAIK